MERDGRDVAELGSVAPRRVGEEEVGQASNVARKATDAGSESEGGDCCSVPRDLGHVDRGGLV